MTKWKPPPGFVRLSSGPFSDRRVDSDSGHKDTGTPGTGFERDARELIEHGITVGGKPSRNHLEAVDHVKAKSPALCRW